MKFFVGPGFYEKIEKKNPTKKSVTKMNYTWVGIKYGNFYDKNEQASAPKNIIINEKGAKKWHRK